MAQVVEPAGLRGPSVRQPFLARLPALPCARREAENLGLDRAAFEGAREDIGADRRDRDRTPAHRAAVVDQQRHHRVAELGVALDLVAHRVRRVGDDPHQPRGIEQSFFLIEIPAAVLLRHQAALQPVGELGHRRLQRYQLLVEIGAEPGQLLGVAEVVGTDDFVVGAGIGAVVEIGRQVGHRGVRPPRGHPLLPLVALLGVGHHVGVHLDFAAFRRVTLVVRRLGAGLGRLVLAAGVLIGVVAFVAGRFLVGLVLGVIAVLGVGVRIDTETEVREHAAHHLRECRLVTAGRDQIVEMRPRLALDIVADQIERVLGGLGCGRAGQPLAHQQAERRRQRHLVGGAGADDRIGAHPHLGHPVEIGRDAGHLGRSQRLDPCLLDGVPDIAGDPRFGLVDTVELHVVVAAAQRKSIGPAAHLGDLVSRQRTRRLGDPRLFAEARRLVGGVRQFDLGGMAERAECRRNRLAEIFERVFGLDHSPQYLGAERCESHVSRNDGHAARAIPNPEPPPTRASRLARAAPVPARRPSPA